MTIQSFGEPWRNDPIGIRHLINTPRGRSTLSSSSVHNLARAQECVNALAGRDPSKLAALEAAVEELIKKRDDDPGFEEQEWKRLCAALAAFKGETA